jgi:hypothetical protein
MKNEQNTLVEAIKAGIDKAKENYKKPTPWNWRVIGDTILGLGTVVTVISGIIKNPWLAVASAVLTWVGKTMTNFATK